MFLDRSPVSLGRTPGTCHKAHGPFSSASVWGESHWVWAIRRSDRTGIPEDSSAPPENRGWGAPARLVPAGQIGDKRSAGLSHLPEVPPLPWPLPGTPCPGRVQGSANPGTREDTGPGVRRGAGEGEELRGPARARTVLPAARLSFGCDPSRLHSSDT